jgi:hypothetical protein
VEARLVDLASEDEVRGNGGDRGEFPAGSGFKKDDQFSPGSGFKKAGSLAASEIQRAWVSWQEIWSGLRFGRAWVSAVSEIRPVKGERERERESAEEIFWTGEGKGIFVFV